MNIQYITAPDGTQMAVLPAHELDNMGKISDQDVQDYLDSHAINTAISHVQQMGEQGIPHEIIGRIVMDEQNPIRVYREWRQYTIKQLADMVGISYDYLAKLERNERDGTISVYQKLAKALNIDIESLLIAHD